MKRIGRFVAAGLAAVLLMLMALRALRPDKSSAAYHLNRMAYLKRTWPPVDPSITEPIRTLRWYLQGRPSRADWGERVAKHQQALTASGFFMQRTWQVTERKVDRQWWGEFRDAMRAAGLNQKQFGMDFQSNSVFHIAACTSDMPTFDSIFKQMERSKNEGIR
jgi:hypothetical protein